MVVLLLALAACGTEADGGGGDGPDRGALLEPVRSGRVATDGGATRGVAWGDFDGDGDPDLYVANAGGQWNAFYRNLLLGARGDGRAPAGEPSSAGSGGGAGEPGEAGSRGGDGPPTLLKLTDPALSPLAETVRHGGASEGVSWVDHDGDGDLDLFVANRGGQADFLFRNDGGGAFVRVMDSGLTGREASASMACWADVDLDGWLDVFVTGYGGDPDVLYRNLGEGRFEAVSQGPVTGGAGEARACGWADADGDGDPDLYVANNPGAPNRYLMNRGEWRFEAVEEGHAVEHLAYSYGMSWADYDGDGDPDLFVANFDRENVLYWNDGSGHLTPDESSLLSTDRGGASKGHAWGDYDLDGDLDLFVANGTYAPDMRNFLYLNRGDGTFERDTRGEVVEHADTSAGAAWADYDRDGDLDLFVASWGSSDEVNRLYRGTAAGATGPSWVAFRLRGSPPNTFAVGARVDAVAEVGGRILRQTRWQWPATGYASQNEQLVHFGLGDAEVVDSLVVHWPGGGRDVHTGVAVRRFWTVEQGGLLEVADPVR